MSATPHLLTAGAGDKRFAFIWMRGVRLSALPSTTKLVLFTLATFMDSDGGKCFPSIAAIAAGCSLTRKAVMPHLRSAEELGFIRIAVSSARHGYGWRRHNYVPVLVSIAVTEGDCDIMGTHGDHDSMAAGHLSSLGGNFDAHQAVTQGDTTYPKTDSKTYPNRQVDFSELWSSWPEKSRPSHRDYTQRIFCGLTADEQRQAVEAAPIFLRCMQLRKQPPLMVKFLMGRQFVEFHGAPPLDKDGDFIITPARQEWRAWLDDVRRQFGERAVEATMNLTPPKIIRKSRWPDRGDDRRPAAERAA